jgi:hypothetical protein
MFNQFVKDPYSLPPKRSRFGSRPKLISLGVLELVALAKSASFSRLRHFCANFLRLSRFQSHVKVIYFSLSGRSNSLLAVVPAERSRPLDKANLISRKSHSAKYQRSTDERPASPEPLRLTGYSPGSCNRLFSVGFPTGVQGFLTNKPRLTQRTSITLASHFPLRGRPCGHREALLLRLATFARLAHLQLSKSSTASLELQIVG